MNIPHDVFAKKRPIRDKALKYGFEPIKNSTSGHNGEAAADALMYSSNIMNGDLTCKVVIEKDAAVKCRLIDTNTGEDYAPVNIESYTGSYVGAVREEYKKTLEAIAAECFDDIPEALLEAEKKHGAEKLYWIIPSNPANYDVAKGFRDSGNDTIPWHHMIKVMPGDIVYIYQTEPVAAIMYKCEVTRSFLPRPASWRGYAPSSKYRMNLHLIEAYDKSKYPRTWMNEHGIKKTVRGQRSAPPELVRAIEQND